MLRPDRNGHLAVENGWAVLMARIVDCDGVSVRPSDVSAIDYSLCELDPRWSNQLNVVAGQCALPLEVDEVFFDGLEVDGMWSVDTVGYNFHHEIDLGRGLPPPRAGFQYEARYEITLKSGDWTIIRFQLRC